MLKNSDDLVFSKQKIKKQPLFFIALVIMLLQGITVVQAQEKPEDVTERFFELYIEKGSDAAVDYVFSTNIWLNGEKVAVENIKAQLKKGIAIIGMYYGYELIEKRQLGESFVLLDYMLRYSRQPIRFTFILYKPDKAWQIQNLKFDDRLDDNIEEK
jgi:hypothetical protein